MEIKTSKNANHDAWLRERLSDREFAAEYLSAAAEDEEPGVYLLALRKVAEAQGMAAIAERSGVPRESLYRALSARGNPRWQTLAAVLRATGMRLAVTAAPAHKRPPGVARSAGRR